MKKAYQSFYIKILLWFVSCSLIIWFLSYFTIKESLSTNNLFNIPMPKYFLLLIGLIWIVTLVFSIFTIIESKTEKIMPKVCFLLLLLSILFIITVAGIFLKVSIQNGLDYHESLKGFFMGIPASNSNFWGVVAVILNFGAIGVIVDTAKKYVATKTAKHVVLITSGLSILLVLGMIAIQSLLYNIIRGFGFHYPRNVFEAVFAVGMILTCLILVRKNIKKNNSKYPCKS